MTSATTTTALPESEIRERLDRLLLDIQTAAQQQIG